MSKQYPLNVPAPHHFTYAVRDLPEVTVEQREQEGSNDGNEYAHRDEFEPPRLGTECGDAGAEPYAMRSH